MHIKCCNRIIFKYNCMTNYIPCSLLSILGNHLQVLFDKCKLISKNHHFEIISETCFKLVYLEHL